MSLQHTEKRRSFCNSYTFNNTRNAREKHRLCLVLERTRVGECFIIYVYRCTTFAADVWTVQTLSVMDKVR